MAADGLLHVELVAPDRTVWSGEADMVIARTIEGDVGVLRGHAPLLSLLTDAVVEISNAWSDGDARFAPALPMTSGRSSATDAFQAGERPVS